MDFGLCAYLRNHPGQIAQPVPAGFQPQRILVFSNTALGDTLLSTPALVSLRRAFPEARLALFVHKNFLPLFEGGDYVDELLPFYGGYNRFGETVRRLRAWKPDTALLLHSNGPQDIPMAILSGARVVLKHPNDSSYRHYLSQQLESKGEHIIKERLDVIRALGVAETVTRMALPARYQAAIPDPLRLEFGGRPVIGFQVGAANIYKMWPVERFAELARRLTADGKTTVVVTGVGQESELADRIVAACPEGRVVNACNRYSAAELPWLLKQFDLLVSNDTGTMHLAIALEIPTLCLFGATESRLIGPYQDHDRHRVIQKSGVELIRHIAKAKRSDEGMRLIEVDEVEHAVKEMLA